MSNIVKQEATEIAAQDKPQDFLAVIEKAILGGNLDMNNLERLLAFQEKIMAKNAEIAFNQAMTRLQAELPRIKRNGGVSYKNKDTGKMEEAFKFAKYEDIDEAIRPALLAEGFSLSFNTKWGDTGPTIYGTLAHQEGHSRTVEMRLPLDSSGGKNNLQGMGSTISYGKRYAVGMLLNIVTVGEDDDGKGASELLDTEKAADIDSRLRKLPDYEVYLPKFLAYLKVEKITDIAASDWLKADNAVSAKEQASKKVAK